MPYPQGTITAQLGNRLIYAERDYDEASLRDQFQNFFKSLTGYLLLFIKKPYHY